MNLIKVSELGIIVTGHTPPRKIEEYFGDAYIWIKPTDIDKGKRFVPNPEEGFSIKAYEKYKNSILPPNSTCVVTIGTVGEKICMTKEPSFTNQAINTIIPNTEKFDPMYVYYLMKYNLDQVLQRNSGTASGRQNISKSDFGNIELKTHELPEQKIIGCILSKFDELLENNDEKIKKIDHILKIIFYEWFDKFQIPSTKIKKSSNRKKIPDGWEERKLGEMITFVKGKKAELIDEKESEKTTPYLLLEGIETSSYVQTSDLSGVYATKQDILMVMDGGSSGIVHIGQQGYVGSTIAVIKIKHPLLNPYYLMQYLIMNFDRIESNNTGAAIPHANKDYVGSMKIIIPKEKNKQPIFKMFQSLFEEKLNVQDKNKIILHTRNMMIKNLISNTMNIKNLKIKCEEIQNE